MSKKHSWETKLINHFGVNEFTTAEALSIITYKGMMAFSMQSMAGKLKCSKRFKKIGMKEIMPGYCNRIQTINIWRVA